MTAPEPFPARARRLIAEATPGPLEADEHGVVRAGPMLHYARGSGRQQLLAVMMLELSDDDTAEAMLARRVADTTLIPLAVNSLGPLLDVVEAAKKARTALDEMVTTQEEWETAVQKVIHTSPNVFPRAIDTGRAALAALRGALARLEVTE